MTQAMSTLQENVQISATKDPNQLYGNISCFWHLVFGINIYAVVSFTLTAFLDMNKKANKDKISQTQNINDMIN